MLVSHQPLWVQPVSYSRRPYCAQRTRRKLTVKEYLHVTESHVIELCGKNADERVHFDRTRKTHYIQSLFVFCEANGSTRHKKSGKRKPLLLVRITRSPRKVKQIQRAEAIPPAVNRHPQLSTTNPCLIPASPSRSSPLLPLF